MKSIFVKTTRIAAVTLLSFSLTSGCGNKKSESEGLEIQFFPKNEVLIAPGPVASCLDRADAQAGEINYSVQNPVIQFSKVRLFWTLPNHDLYIKMFRIIVESQFIVDGRYEASLTMDEVDAILATSGGFISKSGPKQIDSTSPWRADVGLPICGVAFGGVTVLNPKTATPFRANVTIEIVGTAQDNEGNERFVRTRFRTHARFEGI